MIVAAPSSLSDYTKVLDGGPWHFEGRIVVLSKISESDKMDGVEPSMFPVWVRLSHLKWCWFNKDALSGDWKGGIGAGSVNKAFSSGHSSDMNSSSPVYTTDQAGTAVRQPRPSIGLMKMTGIIWVGSVFGLYWGIPMGKRNIVHCLGLCMFGLMMSLLVVSGSFCGFWLVFVCVVGLFVMLKTGTRVAGRSMTH